MSRKDKKPRENKKPTEDLHKMTISGSEIMHERNQCSQLQEHYVTHFEQTPCVHGVSVWKVPTSLPTECICPQVPDTPPLQHQYYCHSPGSPESQVPEAFPEEYKIPNDKGPWDAVPWDGSGQSAVQQYKDPTQLPWCEQETLFLTFPSSLCGKLIGKRGRNIKALMNQTGTFLSLEEPKNNMSLPVLRISGEKERIMQAKKLIEEKFANLRLSEMGEWKVLPVLCDLDANVEVRQLLLNRDIAEVIVSNIINAGHMYLQMISVTTKSLLESLQTGMKECYEKTGIPKVGPNPVIGTYCVVQTHDGWFRAQVIRRLGNTEVEALFVDFGTLHIVQTSTLWKMRSDFFEIPFQAIECCLYNVIPQKGEVLFSLEALSALQELTTGKVLQAIPRTEREGIPHVELFVKQENQVISINRYLVENGLADRSESSP